MGPTSAISPGLQSLVLKGHPSCELLPSPAVAGPRLLCRDRRVWCTHHPGHGTADVQGVQHADHTHWC